MRYVLGGIDRVRDGYVAVVRRLARVAIVGVAIVAGVLAASAWLFGKIPQSFLPEEDHGAIFAALRLPEGTSINRTEAVAKQVEDIVTPIPGVEGILSVVGLNFIDYITSSNQAFFVIRLKPYEARTDPAQGASAIISRLRPQMAAIKGAIAFPFNLPPILGLGSTGGFQYALEALQGQPPTDVAAALRRLLVAANGQPELAGVFSTYAADTPQIYLDIDRDKAQILGVKITDIFNALQSTLGSYYVNDFNVFGRTWRVNVQAETPFRDRVDDIYRIYVRNAQGRWCRFARWPRRSSCKGRKRWCVTTDSAARLSTARRNPATVPARRSPLWSAPLRQPCLLATASNGPEPRSSKKAASGRTAIAPELAVLFAYLFLVALYESWSIPVRALLSVSVGVLGSIVAVMLAGLSFDVYAQIGLVVLIALAAKKGILIIVFVVEQRRLGKTIDASAIDAADLRFRPVMMTSFAFILGLLPLVIAGAGGCHAPSSKHAGIWRHVRGIRLWDFRYSAALHHRGKLASADTPPENKVIAARKTTFRSML
jgi:hydrophobic/amphiphilic exporter-1 (mainly G- bacteria), HAE1 family